MLYIYFLFNLWKKINMKEKGRKESEMWFSNCLLRENKES